MKKITLEKLLEESGEGEYPKQYAYVKGLLDAGRIVPVKSAATNGRKPALPLSFWLVPGSGETEEAEEELKYRTNLRISTDYYLHHPDNYRRERKWVRQLNDFLEREDLECRISLNERSFQIFGREKFLRKEEGRRILAHCGMKAEDLNIYDTTEPLAYYSAGREVPQGILLIENKDTFYTFRNYLMDGEGRIFGTGISTVIYGAGKGIYRSITDLFFCMEAYMRYPENEFLYFGDLDYEGLGIYEHLARSLAGEREIKPFAAAYELMIKKAFAMGIPALPETKEAQNKNLSGTFLAFFPEETVGQIRQILESGRYVPQEIINISDLKKG